MEKRNKWRTKRETFLVLDVFHSTTQYISYWSNRESTVNNFITYASVNVVSINGYIGIQ